MLDNAKGRGEQARKGALEALIALLVEGSAAQRPGRLASLTAAVTRSMTCGSPLLPAKHECGRSQTLRHS